MQLLMMLAVVAAVAISDSAPRQPITDGPLYLMLALACMTAVPLFAVAVAHVTVSQIRSGVERQHWLRRFTRLRTAHTVLWSASIAAVLYGFGWPQIVRCNWQLEGLFLAEDLLILFPVVIPLLLSWAVFYEVDRALAVAHSGSGQPLESRASYVAMYVRHDLGLLLVPVISLFALQDTIRWIAPQFDQQGYAPVVYLSMLAVLMVFFPLVLSRIWDTQPLPEGPLRRRLFATCRGERAPVRDILVWHTGDRIVNAAVAGFVRRWRYIFLTDGLLRFLTHDQIEAITAHEIGHIRHRHLWLRMLAIAAPVAALFGAGAQFADVMFNNSWQWIVWPLASMLSRSLGPILASLSIRPTSLPVARTALRVIARCDTARRWKGYRA